MRSLRQVFGVPAVVALVSGAGLVVALLGEGWVDVLCWPAIAAPVFAAGWAYVRRPR